MIDVPIVLVGYGPVGQQYVELVRQHHAQWRDQYGADLRVVAVRGRSTQAEIDGVVPPREQWTPAEELAELLARAGARVLAQAVPSDGGDQPALDALQALQQGAHVVTATKSHLLTHWRQLDATARQARRSVRISGATGAAMPAGDLARSVLRGFDVRAVQGCLNGTATFVLDQLAAGHDLAAAVTEARRRGIAEADPAADLSGKDAATKLRLLAGLLWGWDVADTTVEAEPIREPLPPVADGHRLRQVAGATLDEPGLVRVELRAEPVASPLGALVGPEKAVRYDCGEAGVVAVSGGRSSPRGAALAMIKDTLGAVLEATTGFR
ncbi:homoserine dehydrogenase [Saccharopolyspora phatthalungensis]|uniref:Homoserine dehydrogenase n=1 Tax=Saccharopolyspora phatthalungensis TaxID=664693 RepID=A0A840Q746_9PSEU|nr:homoserine dehydrogenase [Saccharopolyspora phatthalungensis]MBB5152633.1 homoserine dehydrogenase [Saccharopolyspora phatthalungensis]